MKGKAKIENPEQLEITITITKTLGDWRMLKKELENAESYAADDLRRTISDMVFDLVVKAEVYLNE